MLFLPRHVHQPSRPALPEVSSGEDSIPERKMTGSATCAACRHEFVATYNICFNDPKSRLVNVTSYCVV
jgi:hypothetical protein